MPLLVCANCQVNMQALNRAGVEFDMCPTCRGVWLDRGELEKIIQGARDDEPPSRQQAAPAPHAQKLPRSEAYRERGEHGESGEYGERGRADPRRRKRGFDLFDIFE